MSGFRVLETRVRRQKKLKGGNEGHVLGTARKEKKLGTIRLAREAGRQFLGFILILFYFLFMG